MCFEVIHDAPAAAEWMTAATLRNSTIPTGDWPAMRVDPVTFEVVNNAPVGAAEWMTAATLRNPTIPTGG